MASQRITKKKYEKARAVVADAREQMTLIKQWDEALKQVDHPETVDAITINDDGSTRYEVVHAAKPKSSSADSVQ